MKKNHFISLLLILLYQHVLAQNPFVTNYTIEDGLPSNKVFCVLQDSKGFMWFGTDAGVTRFDGNQFVHFNENNGLSGNVVVRIKEDLSGRIWFLNFSGTLNYFYNDIIYNTENAPFLAELETNFFFHNFYEDTDSLIYFYNQASEIYVVKNNQYLDYQSYNKKPDNTSRTTYLFNKDSNGNFLLWTDDGLLKLKDINTLEERKNLVIQKAFSVENYNTFILDESGNVSLFHNDTLMQSNGFHSESQIINDIVVDRDGYVWVSTYDQGLYCFKDNSLIFHLDIRLIQNLILDNENNIWTASNFNGIYKINRDILNSNFIDKNEFDNSGITELSKANNDGIWATNGQSLFWIHNQKKFNRKISIGGHILESIHQLKNNTVIISGSNTNLRFIEDVKVDAEEDVLEIGKMIRLGFSVKNVAIDSTESHFYSIANDKLIDLDLNTKYTNFYQLGVGRINNLFINNKNQLVVKGSRYVVLENDLIYNTSIYQEFNEQIITSHINIDSENEILNIYGNNLILNHNDKLYNLTEHLKSLIDYRIQDIFYYNNTLFFFTVKTVYSISNPLDFIDGAELKINRINIEFNNINDILCEDSVLYVASDNGLTMLPIEESINYKQQPTKPYFTKVSLDDTNYNLASNLVDFKNKKRLAIEFSSLNYSSIPSEYSYKMKGINEDWIEGRETRVVYLNLEPGSYTFQLKSRKNKEPYSEIIELPIIVHPTIIQRTSTKIALLILLLLLISLIVRAIYRRKIKQKETDHLLISLEHKALQSMMNPHFIFNALGSIQGYLLQNKSSEAGTYLSQFARLIRQNMNSLKSNYICIDDEVERLRNYIDLEKLRMNNRFDFEIYVDENIDSYEVCIPSMTVQPFIENAIWHGISTIEDGGKIKVTFNSLDEKSIEVIVEDNGVGIENSNPTAKSGHGLNMGMNLTKKRLRLIGERYGVTSEISSKNISNDPDWPGTQIKIIIPIVDGES
ncbi:histidine kinase [uncultured Draconibacterium sp.]|uniref:histidine kinase n=1 Tax=uncultured Draconibacterium sp. TaxID=1573823 RepID=UPI003217E4B5